ncbi:ABC transporter ATP-binding protein [Streptacidiphilus sp. PB12-B1b]|uniref:ATP-binding cassette domain-containing protein n=1 Tax=Streptacidiphilus sp. PB12-B1b TaxID=2705012 RepID=UPI0015FC9A17|nr:ABC transporter ATP-binding protein [Streptacidiphilus sp. PB12-B1b]QMU77034.1 ABC transporter ATP-binding protein [Streptacidiphilus sp. PB12-B1b]
MRRTDPPPPPGRRRWEPVRRLLRDGLRRNRRAVLLLTLWTLLSAAPALVCGKALAYAVDRGFLGRQPAAAAEWLGVFAAVTVAGAWAGRQTYPWLAEIVEPMRDALLRDVVGGTLRRAADRAAPRTHADAVVVAQLTRQVEAVRDSVAGQLMIVWQFTLTAAAVIGGTAALAPAVVPLIALPLVAALCLFAALMPTMVRRQRAAFLAEERLSRVAVDTLEALRDLVAWGAGERSEAEALRAVEAQAAAARSLAWAAAVRRLVVALGAHVPLLLILLAAPALVRHGLSAGAVVGVLSYAVSTLEPALRLLVQGVGASCLRLGVAAERLAEAARPPAVRAEPEGTARPADGSLRLRHVSFAYGPQAEPVLRDLGLFLAPGEHLAVVGPSGIGKSTLADILAGITAPDRGSVRLGGVPLPRIPARELHRARVLLPQEGYVFAGTLRENLRYLAPGAADRALAEAAERLGLGATLARLGGLDSPVDPAGLSAGEKQLIALARAYVSTARLVILDEATCHLDAAAEARAEDAFHDRPGTVVTVAHRISSARRADRILLLDGGPPRIGTHAELLAGAPLYAELVGHWEAVPAARPGR